MELIELLGWVALGFVPVPMLGTLEIASRKFAKAGSTVLRTEIVGGELDIGI